MCFKWERSVISQCERESETWSDTTDVGGRAGEREELQSGSTYFRCSPPCLHPSTLSIHLFLPSFLQISWETHSDRMDIDWSAHGLERSREWGSKRRWGGERERESKRDRRTVLNNQSSYPVVVWSPPHSVFSAAKKLKNGDFGLLVLWTLDLSPGWKEDGLMRKWMDTRDRRVDGCTLTNWL